MREKEEEEGRPRRRKEGLDRAAGGQREAVAAARGGQGREDPQKEPAGRV